MNRNRLWLIGTSVVVVAIVLLGWLVGVSPKLTEAQAALDAARDVDAQNAQQEASLMILRDQHDNLDALRAELADLQLQIPESEQLEDFLDDIAAAAASSATVIRSVTSGEAVPYSAAPVETAGTAPAEGGAVEGEAQAAPVEEVAVGGAPALVPSGALAPMLFTIDVTIQVLGDAPSVFSFSKQLQTGTRIFLVTDLVYDSAAADGTVIQGTLYVVRDAAAYAAARVAEAESEAASEPQPEATTTPTPTPSPTPSG